MDLTRNLNKLLLTLTAFWAILCTAVYAFGLFWVSAYVSVAAHELGEAGLLNPTAITALSGTPSHPGANAATSASAQLAAAVKAGTVHPAMISLAVILALTLATCIWFACFPSGLPRTGRTNPSTASPSPPRRWRTVAVVALSLNALVTGGSWAVGSHLVQAVPQHTAKVVDQWAAAGALTATHTPDDPELDPETRNAAINADFFFAPSLGNVHNAQQITLTIGALLGTVMLASIGIAALASRTAGPRKPTPA
jgi:hypothetical protein